MTNEASSRQCAFTTEVDYLTALAMTPGWWAHARHRAAERESEDHGLYIGLREAIRTRLTEAKFRPAPEELGEWWILKSEAERDAERPKNERNAKKEGRSR